MNAVFASSSFWYKWAIKQVAAFCTNYVDSIACQVQKESQKNSPVHRLTGRIGPYTTPCRLKSWHHSCEHANGCQTPLCDFKCKRLEPYLALRPPKNIGITCEWNYTQCKWYWWDVSCNRHNKFGSASHKVHWNNYKTFNLLSSFINLDLRESENLLYEWRTE